MKKGLALIAIVIIAVVIYFVFSAETDEKKPAAKHEKQPRLAISKNPAVFNTAFGKMLNSYYTLKDALVNWDSTKAGVQATTLGKLAAQVPYDLLKADSNVVLTAKNFSGVIIIESSNLAKAATIEDKRHSFNTISDNLYSLINTVRYDKEVIYHDMCPMAFGEDKQAYWLSKDSIISNPYLGNQHPKYHAGMVTCGEVEDSISFVSK